MITKQEMDELCEKYETEDFIKNDPIQFPHRFCNEKDIEISAFITSCFSYGNRKVFIEKLNELFCIMDNRPYEYIMNFDKNNNFDFCYRFQKCFDVVCFFEKIHNLYKNGSSLKTLFEEHSKNGILPMLQKVCDYFYDCENLTQGYCNLIPNPNKGGAMKRLNMFLRWMVRKAPVDLNLWKFIQPSELLIPFDTHVAQMSRKLGFLHRNANDMKSVMEVMEYLRGFDKNDPVKYDFALFGYGISHK
jgi:uncharacterized protein (TIGR02757 family)